MSNLWEAGLGAVIGMLAGVVFVLSLTVKSLLKRKERGEHDEDA